MPHSRVEKTGKTGEPWSGDFVSIVNTETTTASETVLRDECGKHNREG